MTDIKRCPTCNNKKLTHCKGKVKSCDCNCTRYEDNKRNKEPEPTQYTKESQESFEKLQENWRNRKK